MRAVRTAWGEALGNVVATPLRFGLVAVAVAASVLFVATREASLVRQLDQQARDRVELGEFVSVAVGSSDGAKAAEIPATACDQLVSIGGITAAGIVRQSGRITVDTHPTGGYSQVEISPGYLGIIAYQKDPGEVLVGVGAANELGLHDGSVVSIAGQPLTVMILDARGARTEMLDRSFVHVRPRDEVAGVCYVEFAGTDHSQASLLLPGLLGQGVAVSPLVGDLGTSPAEQYLRRFDRLLWVALAFLPLIAGVLVTGSRRNELALYSTLGAGRTLMALMLSFEWLILAVPAATLTVPAVAFRAGGDGAVAAYGLRVGAVELLAVLIVASLFNVLTMVRRPSVYELLRRAE